MTLIWEQLELGFEAIQVVLNGTEQHNLYEDTKESFLQLLKMQLSCILDDVGVSVLEGGRGLLLKFFGPAFAFSYDIIFIFKV